MKNKHTPNPKTVGHNISIARKQQKMSVEELARKVNMRVSYINDIENDTLTDVPADILQRIARTLGTTIADLAGMPSRMRKDGYL